MKCVILAGGGGLRLWPLSRKKYPKQFLKITGENTMFEETVLRNKAFCDSYMVLTNDEFRFIVESQMEKVGIESSDILLETIGRNTAPAITLACMKSDKDDILFVVPADAKIEEGDLYADAVNQAKQFADKGNIVTFGIKPSSPHTGYGYINYKGNDVLAFKEKPNLFMAKQYFEGGGYLWNSGMFMFKAGVFLEEIKKFRNDIYTECKNLVNSLPESNVVVLEKSELEKIPSESVDYAVMEKSSRMKVIPSYFRWNDIGGLEALCDELGKDNNHNSKSEDKSILNDCENVKIINDTSDQLVIANCIKNAIVVNTNDAIYISEYGKSANIKEIIEQNKQKFGEFFESNIKSYRPWGFYEVLINDIGYKVKRITVYPHKRLSLQKHQFRSEHWIVVSGLATITIGNETNDYSANHSTYIPIGEIHRIANNTEGNVEIIEIAVGEKIVEEDIIRLEDDFYRTN
jgi:mannose-1-phosphate guanylyltransferase